MKDRIRTVASQPDGFVGRAASYGALTNERVHVDVYVPANVFAGTLSFQLGVTVWLPIPVLAALLNSLVAVGADPAAGNVYG
jgi:hypothetical protein